MWTPFKISTFCEYPLTNLAQKCLQIDLQHSTANKLLKCINIDDLEQP